MGLSINVNLSSSLSLLALNSNLNSMFKSAERLSSGRRINKASDDPAGLVISEQLRSRIASLGQEIENINMSIGKYQTTSSAVSGLRSQLTDLRTLAIGASNEGGNSDSAQQAYSDSAIQIVSSFNAAASAAEYNGQKTLDGSENSLASVSQLTSIDLSTAATAQDSIVAIDSAIAELDAVQANLGSTQKNELESSRSSLEITRQNLTAAESLIRDVDYAQEFSNFVGSMIRTQISMAMLSHTAVTGKSVLSLLKM